MDDWNALRWRVVDGRRPTLPSHSSMRLNFAGRSLSGIKTAGAVERCFRAADSASVSFSEGVRTPQLHAGSESEMSR